MKKKEDSKQKGSPYPAEYALLATTRTINLFREISVYSIQDVIEKCDYLKSLDPKAVITIRICSGGGSVDAGICLYDYIKASNPPIRIHGTGLMASMAAILLACGKKGHRFVSKNSRIMIHQPSSGMEGTAKSLEIHTKELSRIKDKLAVLFAKDTGQSLKIVKKDMEIDKWMTAEEALKYGVVDKII